MDLLGPLNEQQRLAVLHGEGPAIVLAGAGSGKTRVLTTRAAYLLSDSERQSQPENILLLTFTNKAAGEMQSRVQLLTNQKLPYAGTFHRLCAKLLRQHAPRVGLPHQYAIYDDDDQLSLIKLILKEMNIDPKQYHPRAVMASISEAKQQLISAADYANFARGHFQEKVSKVYLEYEKRLLRSGAVDFDNLLVKTIELLRLNPEIQRSYQQLWRWILIDEYQDTNHAQYVLTKLLISAPNNLFVVGDMSQAIYGWRGADYRNMLKLKQDFANLEEYRLEKNYRSTPTILQAASQVIKNNSSHPVLELWTENADQAKIQLLECASGYSEASHIARLIKELDLDLNEIAVLYRTNAQSRSFEEAFIREGLAYRLVGGVRFYARKEVKDVLAYLALVYRPDNEVAQNRIIKLGKQRYQLFETWREKNQSDSDEKPLATLEIIDGVLAATKYLEKFDEKNPEDVSRLENIQELRSVASQFPNLEEFLEQVALVENDEIGEQNNIQQPAVTLMSLHAAKGLEFAAVFLVGLEEGLFPHSRSMFSQDELEEERRLFYVGVTRAKRFLTLSYAKQRYLYGSPQAQLPSRFIREIPADLLEFYRLNGRSKTGRLKNLTGAKSRSRPARRTTNLDELEIDSLLSGEMSIEDFLKQ